MIALLWFLIVAIYIGKIVIFLNTIGKIFILMLENISLVMHHHQEGYQFKSTFL